jgi:hypothetical protein
MSDDASRAAAPARDWRTWHAGYDEPGSPLSIRLEVVRERIRIALDEAPPGVVRVLSLCAGEGRDLIPVLAAHPRRADVTARLVEFEPGIADIARASVRAAGLDDAVEVVTGDAARTDHYADLAPAQIVLLCGIFGNITEADIRATVQGAAMLTARGGAVVWTRHRREPDLVPTIAAWFTESGFTEVWRSGADLPAAVGVGVHRRDAEPSVFEPGRVLFTFIRRG